jgi:hypothetical protein
LLQGVPAQATLEAGQQVMVDTPPGDENSTLRAASFDNIPTSSVYWVHKQRIR